MTPIRTSGFSINEPDHDAKKTGNRKRTFGTYALDDENILSATQNDVFSHGVIKEGEKQEMIDDPVQKALMESMLSSNTQGARTLKATMSVDSLLSFQKKKTKSTFSASAIAKMGFNPFTGQQVLAPPTVAKPEGMSTVSSVLESISKASKAAVLSKAALVELELEEDESD